MNGNLKKLKYSSVIAILMFVLFASTTYAQADALKLRQKKVNQQSVTEQKQNRLTDKDLRTCKGKEVIIKKQIEQVWNLAEKMLGKFDRIVAGVKKYYENKVKPKKTVPNYAELVKDVEVKREAVRLAMDKAEEDALSFSCDNHDPKGTLEKFRADMREVKTALKNYRSAVRNLIVAVHSVSGEPLKTKKPLPTNEGLD